MCPLYGEWDTNLTSSILCVSVSIKKIDFPLPTRMINEIFRLDYRNCNQDVKLAKN